MLLEKVFSANDERQEMSSVRIMERNNMNRFIIVVRVTMSNVVTFSM